MFEIDLKSRQPLYEQIVDNIKQQIIKGVLQANEQLPSVRSLAAELTINPNTIQKAYRELERLGYVSSLPGRGSFVNDPLCSTCCCNQQGTFQLTKSWCVV